MQQSLRAEYNHALELAIQRANAHEVSLLVLFVVTDQIPDANLRHYTFMWQGLSEVMQDLHERNIRMLILNGDPVTEILRFTDKASEVITDMGYLRWQRDLMHRLSTKLREMELCFTEVESDVCIPVQSLSPKEEYAAYSLRYKMIKVIGEEALSFDKTISNPKPFTFSTLQSNLSYKAWIQNDRYYTPQELCQLLTTELYIDDSVKASGFYQGGTSEALRLLDIFCEEKLAYYAERRSDPGMMCQSELSPYLHFGQISVLQIVHKVMESCGHVLSELPWLIGKRKELDGITAGLAAFLEELIVRRELGINFCFYNLNYDSYLCLPLWARQTLEKHRRDKREPEYLLDNLEQANTNDAYWNSAQTELLKTGKMHNYMRMYWGKKIIEWTKDPEEAYIRMLYLNNKYELDGRDPNSYAGIAWCFGKHDRPWQERQIFGSVRYMNSAGLERKFDMSAYVKHVRDL